MKILFLLIPVLLVCSSCKKEIENLNPNPTKTPTVITKTQGYVQLDCENCLIGYGMPDQYKSVKYPYTYASGYNLQAHITAINQHQQITVTIYDTIGKSVYKADKSVPTSGFWDISILLPEVDNSTSSK
jgi:hypothetical protein